MLMLANRNSPAVQACVQHLEMSNELTYGAILKKKTQLRRLPFSPEKISKERMEPLTSR